MIFSLLSIKAVKYHPSSTGTPFETSIFQNHSYAPSNNDTLFMKLNTENVRNVQPSWNVTRFWTTALVVHVFCLFSFNVIQKRSWCFILLGAKKKKKASAGRVQSSWKTTSDVGNVVPPLSWTRQTRWDTVTVRPGLSKKPPSLLLSFHLLTNIIPSWMCF